MSKKLSITLIIFFLISLIIFFTSSFYPFHSIDGQIQKVFSSPLTFFYNIKANGLFSNDNTEVQSLKNENKKLLEKFADYEKLKKDNDALRGQFENSSIETKKLIPANVVGAQGSIDNPNSLVINIGEDDGIKKGMAVITGKNLVGQIDKVSKSYSRVLLPTSRNFSTIGKTAESGAIGLIKGEDDFIVFDNVVITDNISEGDLVITKGEMNDSGIGIPNDIIVGKISSINKTENKSFQNAKLKQVVDYSKLTNVFVVD